MLCLLVRFGTRPSNSQDRLVVRSNLWCGEPGVERWVVMNGLMDTVTRGRFEGRVVDGGGRLGGRVFRNGRGVSPTVTVRDTGLILPRSQVTPVWAFDGRTSTTSASVLFRPPRRPRPGPRTHHRVHFTHVQGVHGSPETQPAGGRGPASVPGRKTWSTTRNQGPG